MIDKAASFNKHGLQNREGCRKTGESQRSNVLSGMPRKDRFLVSHLINTHRIMVIIAISKPGQ